MSEKKIFIDLRKVHLPASSKGREVFSIHDFKVRFERGEGIRIEGTLSLGPLNFLPFLVLHRLTSRLLETGCSCAEKRMCVHTAALLEHLKGWLKEGSSYLIDLTPFFKKKEGVKLDLPALAVERDEEALFYEQAKLLSRSFLRVEPVETPLHIYFQLESPLLIKVIFMGEGGEVFSLKALKRRIIEGGLKRGRREQPGLFSSQDSASFDLVSRYFTAEEAQLSPVTFLKVLQEASLNGYQNLYLEGESAPIEFVPSKMVSSLKGRLEEGRLVFEREWLGSDGTRLEGFVLAGKSFALIDHHVIHFAPFNLADDELRLEKQLLQEGLHRSFWRHFKEQVYDDSFFFRLTLSDELIELLKEPYELPRYMVSLLKKREGFKVTVQSEYGGRQVTLHDPLLPYFPTFSHMRSIEQEMTLLKRIFAFITYLPGQHEGFLPDEKMLLFYQKVMSPLRGVVSFSFDQNDIALLSLDSGHFKVSKSRLNYFEISFQVPGEHVEIALGPLTDALSGKLALKDQKGRFLLFEEKDSPLKTQLMDDAIWLKEKDVPYWSLAGFLQDVDPKRVEMDATSSKAARKIRDWQQGVKKDPLKLSSHLEPLLRHYQKEGFDWLSSLYEYQLSGILADDMGLGKTIQTISLLDAVSQANPEEKHLVIAPTSLCWNWQKEIEKFSKHLSAKVICGDKQQRIKEMQEAKSCNVFIISYALIQKDVEDLPFEFCYVILDEAQAIKNADTLISSKVKTIASKYRLALTGTPIENTLTDLWSLFDFLMPGYLGGYADFNKSVSKDNKEAFLKRLSERIRPFILRRKKEQVLSDLPPIEHATCYVEMEAPQKALYAKAVTEIVTSLEQTIALVGEAKARFQILAGLTRLKQICCHPALIGYPADEVPSAKFSLFLDLIEEIRDGGHRVVVFSQYVSMLALMREALTKSQIPFAYLDGKTRDRLVEVERFNENKEIPVFLLSLKAGGLGLNLTGADRVIHYDLWWNPAVEDQATDRIYRIGQTKNVMSYKLITKGTIEEKIAELQGQKKGLIELLMDQQNPSAFSLSWQQIKELLS
ncbi:MAG: helicase 2 family protein [Chlamydiales bacterium]|nr:helicase 2 family protein [Chlamydiales bacterium]